MKELTYSAGLVSKLLWFNELKKTAILLNENNDREEIKQLVVNENIYQMNNSDRALRIFNYCSKRLDVIDDELKKIFLNSDLEDVKIIALISTMKVEKIVFDFVYEIYRKKLILGEQEITSTDINIFFEYKKSQNLEMQNWSDETNEKMKQTILKILSESGLIKQEAGMKKVQRVLLSYELDSYLRNNLESYYNAITGVN